jgi:hypothetical protein
MKEGLACEGGQRKVVMIHVIHDRCPKVVLCGVARAATAIFWP